MAVVGGATLVLGLAWPGLAAAAPELPPGCERGADRSVTCTYTSPGSSTAFTVPAGVTSVQVTARGASGGDGGAASRFGAPGVGGAGAAVSGTTAVTPGARLTVDVGSVGTTGAVCNSFCASEQAGGPGGPGFGAGGAGGGSTTGPGAAGGGGGGGGGGGSALRDSSGGADGGLVVAGGGGGGGGGPQGSQPNGGRGGDAGAPGDPSNSTPGGQPGAAPGPDGGAGVKSAQRSSGQGGGGGGARGGTAGGPPPAGNSTFNAGAGGGGGSSLGGAVTGSNTGNGSVVITYTEPLAAGAIAATSGSGQSAQTGQAFGQPLVATVTDGVAADTPVPGAPVTFTVTGGSASFPGGASAAANTDDQGRATSPTLTAGTSPGQVTVTATTPGVATATTYTLTVTAAPAAQLTVRGGGTVTAGGQRISVAVDARVAAAGTASGRVAVSGPRPVTFGSRTVDTITRNGPTVTITGTGTGADGRTGPYTLTVRDNGPRNDGVTIGRGGSTVGGTLTTGDIRITG